MAAGSSKTLKFFGEKMKTIKNLGILVLIIITALFAINFVKNNQNSVSVYFVKVKNNQETSVLPVKRKIESNQTPIKTAIVELLKGPSPNEQKSGYYTEIPKNTALLGINENSDRIVINLSKDFEAGGGSESMSMRLKQVNYTAVDAAKNKPVYLELDGKQVKYIGGEGVEVPQPLLKNLNLGRKN